MIQLVTFITHFSKSRAKLSLAVFVFAFAVPTLAILVPRLMPLLAAVPDQT